MKVFVVCANDFPDCVYATEALATEYITRRKATDPQVPRMYWRCYEFNVIEAAI
jgi:hypothetical protein